MRHRRCCGMKSAPLPPPRKRTRRTSRLTVAKQKARSHCQRRSQRSVEHGTRIPAGTTTIIATAAGNKKACRPGSAQPPRNNTPRPQRKRPRRTLMETLCPLYNAKQVESNFLTLPCSLLRMCGPHGVRVGHGSPDPLSAGEMPDGRKALDAHDSTTAGVVGVTFSVQSGLSFQAVACTGGSSDTDLLRATSARPEGCKLPAGRKNKSSPQTRRKNKSCWRSSYLLLATTHEKHKGNNTKNKQH